MIIEKVGAIHFKLTNSPRNLYNVFVSEPNIEKVYNAPLEWKKGT